MNIIKQIVPESKYGRKCPYSMNPTRIVVHNTANDASARNEIAYMTRNDYETSFHYAVDDMEIVQGIEENRNAWHSGDGNGKGNREGIAIEICYSKSGGDRFLKAEDNAVELIVDILKRYNWGIDKVTKHQDYSNKYCPHRTLDMGWDRFLNKIKEKMNEKPSEPILDKTTLELAKEVIAGKYGNGEDRKNALGNRYNEVQSLVNDMLRPKINYLPKCNYNGVSIVDGLKSIKVDSSFNNRSKLASANGISNYKGTAEQNTQLLNLLKNGKLKQA